MVFQSLVKLNSFTSHKTPWKPYKPIRWCIKRLNLIHPNLHHTPDQYGQPVIYLSIWHHGLCIGEGKLLLQGIDGFRLSILAPESSGEIKALPTLIKLSLLVSHKFVSTQIIDQIDQMFDTWYDLQY